MVKIRIRKDNPSGRTEDILDVFGEEVKVNTESWTEIDKSDLMMLNLNPSLYETEEEKKPEKVKKKK